MNFAQRLVDADRASLFLLDTKNKELYARIFDIRGNESENDSDSGSRTQPDREIRLALIKFDLLMFFPNPGKISFKFTPKSSMQ